MPTVRGVQVAVAFCFGLVLVAFGSRAQERVAIPAPPPPSAAPMPAWLDNDVTRRFVAWQKLDAEWKALSASAARSDFVRVAARICLAAAGMPREGEPQPGMRARLVKEACAGALAALPDCYARAAPAVPGGKWDQGFTFDEPPARTHTCGTLQVLAEVLRRAQEVGVAEPHEAARAALASKLAEIERAHDGQRALALPSCERADRLRTLFEHISAPDPAAKIVASAQTQKQLQERWRTVEKGGARYEHVVAYHFAEAQLELQRDAERDTVAASAARDVALATQARDEYACLHQFRDAKAQLSTAQKQLKTLQAHAEKEAACLADPVCVERREAREQRRIERELIRQEAEEERTESRSCCKVCTTGYACGDSCISRSKSCHKGVGCACDG